MSTKKIFFCLICVSVIFVFSPQTTQATTGSLSVDYSSAVCQSDGSIMAGLTATVSNSNFDVRFYTTTGPIQDLTQQTDPTKYFTLTSIFTDPVKNGDKAYLIDKSNSNVLSTITFNLPNCSANTPLLSVAQNYSYFPLKSLTTDSQMNTYPWLVTNGGSSASVLNYSVSTNKSWCTVSPTSGVINGSDINKTQSVSVLANISQLLSTFPTSGANPMQTAHDNGLLNCIVTVNAPSALPTNSIQTSSFDLSYPEVSATPQVSLAFMSGTPAGPFNSGFNVFYDARAVMRKTVSYALLSGAICSFVSGDESPCIQTGSTYGASPYYAGRWNLFSIPSGKSYGSGNGNVSNSTPPLNYSDVIDYDAKYWITGTPPSGVVVRSARLTCSGTFNNHNSPWAVDFDPSSTIFQSLDCLSPNLTITFGPPLASACANGATNYPTCTVCPADSVMKSGTCTPVTVSVTASTPYNTTPSTNVSFAYVPTTNSGSTECLLLDNASLPLTSYQASSPISYKSPNAVGAFSYYVKCRNTATTTAMAISNKITVNTSGVVGSPTASLTANSLYHTLTVIPAQIINWAWDSKYGSTYSSTDTAVKINGRTTDCPYQGVWVADTASGTWPPSSADGYQINCVYTFTYKVTSSSGVVATDSVVLTVLASLPPNSTADIKANNSNGPVNIAYNGTANITWTYTNATSCTLTPAIATITTPPSNGSGSFNATNLVVGKTYSIDCQPGNTHDQVVVSVPAQPKTVTVIKTGQGKVVSNPVGINCGSGCSTQSVDFAADIPVILTATPDSGRLFVGWGGACAGTPKTSTCTIQTDTEKTVNANFIIDPQFREF